MSIDIKNWNTEKKYKLFNQFESAKNFCIDDFNSENYELELEKFFEERKQIGEQYIQFLKKLGIALPALYSTELGKCEEDSLAYTIPFTNSQIVSPNIPTSININRSIVCGNYETSSYRGILVRDVKTGKIIGEDDDNLYELVSKARLPFRYHTYNPYNEFYSDEIQDLELFKQLHNSKHNIAFGMYGKNIDSDKSKKLNILYNLAEELKRPVAVATREDEENYYGVVYTKRKDFIR